jgi:hypothetical protein
VYLISSDTGSDPAPTKGQNVQEPHEAFRLDLWGTFRAMKLVYKPFGIILGIIAGLLSKKVFEAVWGIIDKEEPPKPTTREADWTKVLAAAAVQGVTFKVTRAAVDRAGAKGWDHLFGVWPGDKHQEKSQAAAAVR